MIKFIIKIFWVNFITIIFENKNLGNFQLTSNQMGPNLYEQPQKRLIAQNQWNLGVQLSGTVSTIINSIFKALRSNDIIWKKVAPYCLHCKKNLSHDYHNINYERKVNVSASEDVEIKFEIQFYKIKLDEYVVDIQVILDCQRL